MATMDDEWHLVFSRMNILHARICAEQEIVPAVAWPAEVASPGDAVVFATTQDFQRVVRKHMYDNAYAVVSFPNAPDGATLCCNAAVGNEGWAFEKLAAHLYATRRRVETIRCVYDEHGFTVEATFDDAINET